MKLTISDMAVSEFKSFCGVDVKETIPTVRGQKCCRQGQERGQYKIISHRIFAIYYNRKMGLCLFIHAINISIYLSISTYISLSMLI